MGVDISYCYIYKRKCLAPTSLGPAFSCRVAPRLCEDCTHRLILRMKVLSNFICDIFICDITFDYRVAEPIGGQKSLIFAISLTLYSLKKLFCSLNRAGLWGLFSSISFSKELLFMTWLSCWPSTPIGERLSESANNCWMVVLSDLLIGKVGNSAQSGSPTIVV